MNQKVIDFNKALRKKGLPVVEIGDVIRVHKKIKEGEKERVQIFKGLVIAIKGKQSSSFTITVRRESQKIGVEAVFPVFLPSIQKIEVLRHSKVRRSKLYYMRERSGKAAKMKLRDFSEAEKEAMAKKEAVELKKKTESISKKTENKKGVSKKEEKNKKEENSVKEESGKEIGEKNNQEN